MYLLYNWRKQASEEWEIDVTPLSTITMGDAPFNWLHMGVCVLNIFKISHFNIQYNLTFYIIMLKIINNYLKINIYTGSMWCEDLGLYIYFIYMIYISYLCSIKIYKILFGTLLLVESKKLLKWLKFRSL